MAKPKPSLTSEQIKELESMSAVGLTLDQMASLLGIHARTLDRLIEQNENIKDAVEKGRAKAIFQVGKSAYQQAISGKVPAMTMFYLKCRARWKESHVHEISGPEGKPIEMNHSNKSKDQLKLEAANLIKKLKFKDSE